MMMRASSAWVRREFWVRSESSAAWMSAAGLPTSVMFTREPKAPNGISDWVAVPMTRTGLRCPNCSAICPASVVLPTPSTPSRAIPPASRSASNSAISSTRCRRGAVAHGIDIAGLYGREPALHTNSGKPVAGKRGTVRRRGGSGLGFAVCHRRVSTPPGRYASTAPPDRGTRSCWIWPAGSARRSLVVAGPWCPGAGTSRRWVRLRPGRAGRVGVPSA